MQSEVSVTLSQELLARTRCALCNNGFLAKEVMALTERTSLVTLINCIPFHVKISYNVPIFPFVVGHAFRARTLSSYVYDHTT